MANNTTIDFNDDDDEVHVLFVVFYTFQIIFSIIGTPFNLWMLLGIVTSKDIRKSLQNKLICTILLNDIIKSAIAVPLEIVIFSTEYHTESNPFHCSIHTLMDLARLTVVYIENWYIIIFLSYYIFTLLNFNPTTKFLLSLRSVDIATYTLLVGPWALCLVTAPPVMAHYSHKQHGIDKYGCISFTDVTEWFTIKVGIYTPFFITLAMMLSIILLRRFPERFLNNDDNNLGVSSILPSNAKNNDGKMFISIGIVTIVAHVFFVTSYLFQWYPCDEYKREVYYYFTFMIMEFRPVFQPLCFLYKDEIYGRLKTWRPWKRPSPGDDFSVKYNQSYTMQMPE